MSYDPAGAARVSYQQEYTLEDHLGNLRLAYRAGQVRTLTAALEQDAATRQWETQQFDSLSVSPPVVVATPYRGPAECGRQPAAAVDASRGAHPFESD